MDTHILVWIPSSFYGQRIHTKELLRLQNSLSEFHETERSVNQRLMNAITLYENQFNYVQSGWVLMTTDVLPESRGKSLSHLEKMVKSLDCYTLPKTVESIICNLAESLRSGRCLFSKNPHTFMYGKEIIKSNNKYYRIVVGSDASSGSKVVISFNTNSESTCLAVIRRL